MKTAILFAILFSSTRLTAIETNSQLPVTISSLKPTADAFSFVRGHKLGKGHAIQWSMASNAGIESFIVQSTSEDPNDPYSNWYTVGNVINNNKNLYRITDVNPYPGIVYYRVIAVFTGNRPTITSDIYAATVR